MYRYPTPLKLSSFLVDGVTSSKTGADASAASSGEPAAIVGIGCRLPGGVKCATDYWRMLVDGVDAVTKTPPSTRGGGGNFPGGYLDASPSRFDAAFFNIRDSEKSMMAEEQKLVMEVAYEALEDAGMPKESVEGAKIGVFVGAAGVAAGSSPTSSSSSAYAATGVSASIVANRLSYAFDFRGPSVAVDTACSSSLVALHVACDSLKRGDCDVALVGGVNVLRPEITEMLSGAGFLSPKGKCHAFGNDADGYVRGEGCGFVVLKRFSAAANDGDRIYACVRGTATNSDGRSNGSLAHLTFLIYAARLHVYEVSPYSSKITRAHTLS